MIKCASFELCSKIKPRRTNILTSKLQSVRDNWFKCRLPISDRYYYSLGELTGIQSIQKYEHHPEDKAQFTQNVLLEHTPTRKRPNSMINGSDEE